MIKDYETSYRKVADKLIERESMTLNSLIDNCSDDDNDNLMDSLKTPGDSKSVSLDKKKREKIEKNIRRRVYDALNV